MGPSEAGREQALSDIVAYMRVSGCVCILEDIFFSWLRKHFSCKCGLSTLHSVPLCRPRWSGARLVRPFLFKTYLSTCKGGTKKEMTS